MGPNGVVLLFFRTADWGPFCKQQLVQLQNARDKFQQHGIGLAAVSLHLPRKNGLLAPRRHGGAS
jgi:peroxiredoxin